MDQPLPGVKRAAVNRVAAAMLGVGITSVIGGAGVVAVYYPLRHAHYAIQWLLVFVLMAFGEDDARWGTLIDNLHVRHDVQARGLGRRLMREAAGWVMQTHPGRGMHLWVAQKNYRAQRVYARLGGVNVEAKTHEQHGGGTVDSFRIAWEDPRGLLAPAAGAAK